MIPVVILRLPDWIPIPCIPPLMVETPVTLRFVIFELVYVAVVPLKVVTTPVTILPVAAFKVVRLPVP